MKSSIVRMSVLAALCAAASANAALVDLGPGSFTPLASKITFDEVAMGTVNPVYNFTGLTDLGDITVSFAGAFLGQTVSGSGVKTLTGAPSGPLTLDTSVTVSTVSDGAPGATSPTLSGVPMFNGPISVLFSKPVAAVGLKGGYFNAIGGTSIQAFKADGSILGSITNKTLGFEFYGLAESTGQNLISGISFYITGNEPAGFEIDDLTFGSKAAVNIPAVPEPSSVALVLAGAGIVVTRLRKKKQA